MLECKKESPLWKVFRGCGHSFHIECVLPDKSVCQICQSLFVTKLEALAKTANEAVLSDLSDTFEENEDGTASDDECETDDDDEHYEEHIQTDGRDSKTTIDKLLQRIYQ